MNLVYVSVTVECYAENGDARTVPLSPDLAAALQKLHDEGKPKTEDVVFHTRGPAMVDLEEILPDSVAACQNKRLPLA